MKTPRERYYSDPYFHNLVDMMVHAIMDAKFTPSEMRDAAVYASILYEMEHIKQWSMPMDTIAETIKWMDKNNE